MRVLFITALAAVAAFAEEAPTVANTLVTSKQTPTARCAGVRDPSVLPQDLVGTDP